MTDSIYHFDRSGYLLYDSCPFRYWLERLAFKGQPLTELRPGVFGRPGTDESSVPGHAGGLVRASAYRHLAIGSAVHAALEVALGAVRDNHPIAVHDCMAAAAACWREEIAKGWQGEGVAQDLWPSMVNDYTALVIASSWLVARAIAPAVAAAYDVVLVEEEMRIEIDHGMYFNGRVDAVLRAKVDELLGAAPFTGLVPASFKTVATLPEHTREKYGRDAQGMTEPWLLEQWLKTAHPEIQEQVVDTVQYLFLIKGRTLKDKGYKYNANGLTHPWAKDASNPDDWYPEWESTEKRLSKGYVRRMAWDWPGATGTDLVQRQVQWMEHVAHRFPQAVANLWKMPTCVLRPRAARDRYIRALGAKVYDIRSRAERVVNSTVLSEHEQIAVFPRAVKPEDACMAYQTPCPFLKTICEKGDGSLPPQGLLGILDMQGRQVFVPRQPHHNEELEDDE